MISQRIGMQGEKRSCYYYNKQYRPIKEILFDISSGKNVSNIEKQLVANYNEARRLQKTTKNHGRKN